MSSSDRFTKLLVAVATLVAIDLSASTSEATPEFPGVIAKHLGVATPECTLCHVGTPGSGTANTAFAKTLRARGLLPYDDASLTTALDAISAENKDSDGDGTPDIRELQDGTDPNSAPGDGSITPEYGCEIGRGLRVDSTAGAVPALAFVLLWMLRVAIKRYRGA
ncbi:hypothetical protein AKJ09_10240 [Labilithrix luteola]|uniref:Cytochrome c domain-containing protein n=1 Tax=Labilithrix luteola TaxID=1391654 RepID=A0A0K1QD37_9BACT|nr:thrombospondin type 3 repeat-containing protein [Labilithrix luteola]AKV03577.1 hypothetical protein AKJ09_10240 [Labilithrix luteola]